MAFVYILYSEQIDKYYVGHTGEDPKERLKRHNDNYYENKYTSKGKPWILYLVLFCEDRDHALKVESHIKRMKSRKYIENLNKYDELREKLLARYREI